MEKRENRTVPFSQNGTEIIQCKFFVNFHSGIDKGTVLAYG